MSLVLDAAFGVLAKTSPACTSEPSDTERIESGGKKYRASFPFASQGLTVTYNSWGPYPLNTPFGGGTGTFR